MSGGGNSNKKRNSTLARGLTVGIMTFFLTVTIALLSQWALSFIGLFFASLVLLTIITVGIVFDIIGVAVTVTGEACFHAMAAKKVNGAQQAIRLVRHADRVSSICNDVIGDICGTVSGAAAASIVFQLVVVGLVKNEGVTTLLLVGLVAALTVGGKAVGKNFALQRGREITFTVAKFLAWWERHFGMQIFRDKGQMRRR